MLFSFSLSPLPILGACLAFTTHHPTLPFYLLSSCIAQEYPKIVVARKQNEEVKTNNLHVTIVL